jgi:hypothetical protein
MWKKWCWQKPVGGFLYWVFEWKMRSLCSTPFATKRAKTKQSRFSLEDQPIYCNLKSVLKLLKFVFLPLALCVLSVCDKVLILGGGEGAFYFSSTYYIIYINEQIRNPQYWSEHSFWTCTVKTGLLSLSSSSCTVKTGPLSHHHKKLDLQQQLLSYSISVKNIVQLRSLFVLVGSMRTSHTSFCFVTS